MDIIYKKLNKIFIELFEIDLTTVDEDFFSRNLLSYRTGFKARHLLSLLVNIEKEFNIKVDEKDLIEGRFSNINEIMRIIEEQTNKEEMKYA